MAVAAAVLLVLLGAITAAALLGLWDGDSEPRAGTDQNTSAGTRTATPSTAPDQTAEAGCQDVTAQFDAYARPRAEAGQLSVLDSVELVCWEPSRELRVEAGYPADINADSPPMTWLCAVLSDFLTDGGQDGQGFTVYSLHAATPGVPFLAGQVPGEPCVNPQHEGSRRRGR